MSDIKSLIAQSESMDTDPIEQVDDLVKAEEQSPAEEASEETETDDGDDDSQPSQVDEQSEAPDIDDSVPVEVTEQTEEYANTPDDSPDTDNDLPGGDEEKAEGFDSSQPEAEQVEDSTNGSPDEEWSPALDLEVSGEEPSEETIEPAGSISEEGDSDEASESGEPEPESVPDIGVPELAAEQPPAIPEREDPEERPGFRGFRDSGPVTEDQIDKDDSSDPSAGQNQRSEKQIEQQLASNRDLAEQLANELGPAFDEMRAHQEQTVHDYVSMQNLMNSLLRPRG